MTHPASSIYLLLHNAPKVLYWAKLGHVGRVVIPFQGVHSGLLQKLDSVTRVCVTARTEQKRYSPSRFLLVDNRWQSSPQTHLTVDSSIYICATRNDHRL